MHALTPAAWPPASPRTLRTQQQESGKGSERLRTHTQMAGLHEGRRTTAAHHTVASRAVCPARDVLWLCAVYRVLCGCVLRDVLWLCVVLCAVCCVLSCALCMHTLERDGAVFVSIGQPDPPAVLGHRVELSPAAFAFAVPFPAPCALPCALHFSLPEPQVPAQVDLPRFLGLVKGWVGGRLGVVSRQFVEPGDGRSPGGVSALLLKWVTPPGPSAVD